MEKHGILSRHIILSESSVPIYGIILIQGEIIQDIIRLENSFPPEQAKSKFTQWKIIDFSDSYISPGIIDLSVRKEWENYESLTKAAISGGTTFILEEPSFHDNPENSEELYCDIGKVQVINDVNLNFIDDGALAIKGYLYQPSHGVETLSRVEDALEISERVGVTLIIDPNLPDPRMLYMASPLRLEKTGDHMDKEVNTCNVYAAAFSKNTESGEPSEESEEEEKSCTTSLRENDIQIFKSIIEDMNNESLAAKATLRLSDMSTLKDKREDSLKSDSSLKSLKSHKHKGSKTIFDDLDKKIKENEKNIDVISMAEKNTYQFSGSTQYNKPTELKNNARRRPPTLSLNSSKKVQAKTDYTFYLANCPESWETDGVDSILSKIHQNAKIHFQGISSASAINKIRQKSETAKQLTCEIPASHLFFNNSNIGSHDTRFKTSPPIRSTSNFNLLWELLKMRGICSISSAHVCIDKVHKALETASFQNALNGVCSLGFSLQAVWTTINIPMARVEQLEHYLVRLSKWLSLNPAKILGLADRGSIAKGKVADLIVWTPYCRNLAKASEHYAELNVFDGKELMGEIEKVYIRGNIAYDMGTFFKHGKVVKRISS